MIDIKGAEKGSTVFIDDRRAGTTPLLGPLFVDLGEHEVVVKQGSTEFHREVVKVAGGQFLTIKVESAASEEPRSKRVWTWVAFGVGGAAAIGAAVTGGLSLSKTKDIKNQCDGNTCPGSLQGEGDTAGALGNAASALIAVAGVGLAAGVVLFFVEPKWNKDENAVEIAPVAAPTANGGALALVGRF
jgi:hypothetical protein